MPRSRSNSRDRSRSPEQRTQLPEGVESLKESDYFQKSAEFRVWLKDEKGKYFDQLSGDKARSYFRKFIKAWNRGKTPKLYSGIDPSSQAAATQTAYKWGFASNRSKVDKDALREAREAVGAATYARDSSPPRPSSSRVLGPTLPSSSDLTLSREAASEYDASDRAHKRKRDKLEAKERVEEMVGPKEVGREGMLEKKRAKRDDDRAFRDKGEDGLEADEKTLLGGGDSFRERIAQRDAARKRFDEKRNAGKEDKNVAIRERGSAIKEKDQATMAMLQQLAQSRFG